MTGRNSDDLKQRITRELDALPLDLRLQAISVLDHDHAIDVFKDHGVQNLRRLIVRALGPRSLVARRIGNRIRRELEIASEPRCDHCLLHGHLATQCDLRTVDFYASLRPGAE